MTPNRILSEKDQEIYKNVAKFVYAQGVVTIEEVEQKCNLLSFEAWKIVNVLVAVGVLKERDGAIRVWGSPASSDAFDAIVDDGIADIDDAILSAAEADSRDDLTLQRRHRTMIAHEMMKGCPPEILEATMEICALLFMGKHRGEILDACDRLGIPETGVWLSPRLQPVPPSEKGFVS